MSDYDHRDYELFAQILHGALLRNARLNREHGAQCAARNAISSIAEELAAVFAEDNPGFNTDEFFAAVDMPMPTHEATPDKPQSSHHETKER